MACQDHQILGQDKGGSGGSSSSSSQRGHRQRYDANLVLPSRFEVHPPPLPTYLSIHASMHAAGHCPLLAFWSEPASFGLYLLHSLTRGLATPIPSTTHIVSTARLGTMQQRERGPRAFSSLPRGRGRDARLQQRAVAGLGWVTPTPALAGQATRTSRGRSECECEVGKRSAHPPAEHVCMDGQWHHVVEARDRSIRAS